MLAFGISTSVIYHLSHHDKFQDAILAIGVSLAFLYGTLIDDSVLAVLLGVFPWAVLAALSVSSIGHWMCRFRSGTTIII